MDYRPGDIDKMKPDDTMLVSCPRCENHTFTVHVGTLQMARGIRIRCPQCGGNVGIYINHENELCVE
jgi:Zn finger protein HypA/HybF involved in hydrogenase expression